MAERDSISARATGPGKSWQSAPFDFAAFEAAFAGASHQGPTLTFDQFTTPPQASYSYATPAQPYGGLEGAWLLRAPARLVYKYPAGIENLRFSHGMHPELIHLADGYDLALNWISSEGQRERIWLKRNTHGSSDLFQERQNEDVPLPRREGGLLEFQFSTGQNGNVHDDLFYLGPIEAVADMPYLRINDDFVFAESSSGPSGEPVTSPDPGRWLMHSPSNIHWPRPAHLSTLSFSFGIEDAAYDTVAGNRTDGVGFVLELETPSGEIVTLFQRVLEPLQNPADRGRQTAEVTLPADTPGILVFRSTPGRHGSDAWDWAWVEEFSGRAAD